MLLETILYNYIKNKKNKIQIEHFRNGLLNHLNSIKMRSISVNHEYMSDQGYYDYIKKRKPPSIIYVIEEVSEINSAESLSDYKDRIRKLCKKKEAESGYISMGYKEVLEYLEHHK